jgi:glycosyltransferase involved in cell wall biosynthesis
MENEIVSVMMPVYNGEKYIKKAIESVLEQTFQNFSLIVVNDGSTDTTQEILNQYTDPRIKVFHQENSGEATARNTALSHIESDFISFLDADDLYLPNHLELTINYLQSHPTIDGVYTDGYYINQDNVQLKPLSSQRRGPFEGDIFEEMVRSSDVFGAPVCVVLRRKIIVNQNLTFDPEIVIGPDWDFLAAYSQYAKFGYINQHTCLYRVHSTNISTVTKTQTRIFSLAKCRENAIKFKRFNSCSLKTREFVFYDLLVNILTGYSNQQKTILTFPEFVDLPASYKCTLLRQMAKKAIISNTAPSEAIKRWYNLSAQYCGSDLRTILSKIVYQINPQISNFLLQEKKSIKKTPDYLNPFRELKNKP